MQAFFYRIFSDDIISHRVEIMRPDDSFYSQIFHAIQRRKVRIPVGYRGWIVTDTILLQTVTGNQRPCLYIQHGEAFIRVSF